MKITDEKVWATYQAFERGRVGKRGRDDSTSLDDTAKALGIDYAEVKRVVLDRMFSGYSG